MKPIRVQLSRTKGWRMPPNTIKVDRSTRWGNPYRENMFLEFTASDAVEWFSKWMSGDLGYRSAGIPPDVNELRGKNLACWCKLGEPCHADVLLEVANKPHEKSI